MNDKIASPAIAIVGLGLAGAHQITREAAELVERSTTTYVTGLPRGVADYLRNLCGEVVDLNSEEEIGDHRILIYREMASRVVANALAEPPVCFATYGHPKMYCYPTVLIQRAARVLNLEVRVVPGVSFLDTLLVDLNLDPAMDGLQLYEATDVLVRRRPLQPDVSCVIVQAPIVLDPLNRPGPRESADEFGAFQDYLLEYYPPDHRATLLVSSVHPLLQPLTAKAPIGQIASALRSMGSVATLYIPPVARRAVHDDALAARMSVWDRERGDDLPARRPGRPDIGPQAN